MERKPVILTADDEESVLEFVSTVLAADGFNVLTARDGEEALHLALTELPDLIILDVVMPFKGGLEVFAELRSDSRVGHVPVIILTSVNDYRLGDEITPQSIAATCGAAPEALLEKPVSASTLSATVRDILMKTHGLPG